MKKILLLISLVSFTYAAYTDVQTNLNENELLQVGKKIYLETCISCHGKQGETNSDIQLVVKPRKLQKTILTKEQSFKIIKQGAHYFGAHADIMPTFKYVYNDEEIMAVALYISKIFNNKRDEKIKKLLQQSQMPTSDEKINMLTLGKKVFQRTCALCHGTKGDAKSEYVEMSKKEENFIYPYNLTRTLLDEKQIFLYAKYGGHFWGADKKDMPSWKNKYNDIALKSVAKYIVKVIKHLKKKE